MGTSLVVQWLRLCAHKQGAWNQWLFPGQGTINRPHMLQPKIPHAATKAPGSQKNHFQWQGLGKGWQAPCRTSKVARRSPWCSPRSKPRRWDKENKAFKHKQEEELKAKAERPPCPQEELRNLAKKCSLCLRQWWFLVPFLFKHLDSLPLTSVATYSYNEVLSCLGTNCTFKSKLLWGKKKAMLMTGLSWYKECSEGVKGDKRAGSNNVFTKLWKHRRWNQHNSQCKSTIIQ